MPGEDGEAGLGVLPGLAELARAVLVHVGGVGEILVCYCNLGRVVVMMGRLGRVAVMLGRLWRVAVMMGRLWRVALMFRGLKILLLHTSGAIPYL